MPSQTPNQLDDAALLAAHAKGMPEATRILTERLAPKLYAEAYHRLQNAQALMATQGAEKPNSKGPDIGFLSGLSDFGLILAALKAGPVWL